jgi:glucose uptake protein
LLIPSTHQAALLLLILAFVCLGSWANTVKIAKWRFELYYLDFAIGALGLSILTAFTLGTLGSELSFNDRIAVAGLRSQAFALAAGFLFNLGNMLLVAAVSLAGMSIAFPVALSLAFLVGAYFQGVGSVMLFAGGAALLLVAAGLGVAAARVRSTPRPGMTPQTAKTRRSRAVKGIAVGLIGGLLIGLSAPLAVSSFWGDLGLGAYAGLLMFCIGLAVSAVFFDLFFMNMGIEGGRVTFATYRAGSFRQHAFGIAGGVLWATGILASLLAQSAPNPEVPAQSTLLLFVQGAVLLNMAWGLLAWKEFSVAPKKAVTWIITALICFGGALTLMALRLRA